MVQINTTNLRNFVDKAKSNRGVGKAIFDNSELNAAALDLTSLLLYVSDLENEILRLKKEIAALEIVTVEMQGEKF
jgi:hypothetical protein